MFIIYKWAIASSSQLNYQYQLSISHPDLFMIIHY